MSLKTHQRISENKTSSAKSKREVARDFYEVMLQRSRSNFIYDKQRSNTDPFKPRQLENKTPKFCLLALISQ